MAWKSAWRMIRLIGAWLLMLRDLSLAFRFPLLAYRFAAIVSGCRFAAFRLKVGSLSYL